MQVPASARLHLRTAHSVLTSSRVQRWAGLITSFLAGQGTVQLINLITGFFLLRWMSVESYAQFSIAFGFQSTLQWMVELGATHSIIALTGDRGQDKETVGRYIRSAIYFRKRLFLAIVPLAAIAFPLVTAKHHWGWHIQLLLFISIVSALFFQGFASYYSAPFLINQRIKQYYQPQIFTSIARLVVCVLLRFASLLTSWASAWTNSAVIAVNGWLYRRKASDLVSVPKQVDPTCNREMINYILPALPWLIFSAFQGQISLLLITIFGQTRNIAEIAALGRLGQLFLGLGAFNSIVIAPYIVKVARPQLARRYLQILSGAFAISIFLTAISFIFPEPLLWILGDEYQNLRVEIGWAVAMSCVGYVNTVMMTMHSARKWIYWWWGSLNIITSIIIQIVCIFLFDLSSTLNVLYFSLAATLATFVMLILGGVYGFAYGPPRRLRERFTTEVEN
jgi:O-antigen/teichoic acid export membrane protein